MPEVEQPKEDSKKTETVQPIEDTTEKTEQPAEASERYKFIQGNEEKPKEETKPDEKKDDKKVEPKKLEYEGELTKEKAQELIKDLDDKEEIEIGDKKYANKEEFLKSFEPKEEVDYKLDKDTITVGKGDAKQKLIRVDFEDGTFALVPEQYKSGYLMQADYTKKTQDLAKQKTDLETEKAKDKAQIEYIKTLQFIDEIGKQPLKPIYDPTGDEGEIKKDVENKPIAVVHTDSGKYAMADKAYTEWFSKHAYLENTQKQVKEQNLKMLEDFKTKYGEEEYTKVITEAGKHMNPYIFKELVPYPTDALELIRKGMNYDADIKKVKDETDKKVNDAVLAKVKELEKNQGKQKETPSNQGKTQTEKVDIHPRYGGWIQT